MSSQGFGSGAVVDQSGEIDAIKKLFLGNHNQAFVIFDVGANRGEYSRAIFRCFPNAEVFAFEPSPSTFELLKKQIGENQKARLFKLGLGRDNETRSLFAGIPYARSASLTKHDLCQDSYTETVRITRLDDIVAETGLLVSIS